MGFPDPSPEYSVRGLTYVNMHGDDTPGAGGIPPPEPPPLFSVILGEAKYLLPQTPTSLFRPNCGRGLPPPPPV